AINDEEFFVILGPSGAGKTLLLEIIAGIHFPEEGEIYYNGKNITYSQPHQRNCGFVFQNAALFPNKRVWKNIIYGAKLRNRMSHKKAIKRAEELLKLFAIDYITYRYPFTLSGGEKQRVALARALIIEPDILLLDEPLASVDYNTMHRLKNEIKNIHEKFKTTTIYVTHNRLEAMTLADRIAVMKKGEIEQIGTPDEIFRRPKNEFVAKFIGFDNIFEGEAEYNSETGLTEIELSQTDEKIFSSRDLNGKVKLCIRPEDIILSNKPLKSSMRNAIEGEIIGVNDLGQVFEVKIDIGVPLKSIITHSAFIELNLDAKSNIYINFKASALIPII
ncbi:MAG: ATP-binding cassette domain-containing protein, partial [Candidatus Lokiarchaeota archaeon]|nr:ATP-binding cassette domain-containing protein [Candidatus Lokiarchaeota archaeon]